MKTLVGMRTGFTASAVCAALSFGIDEVAAATVTIEFDDVVAGPYVEDGFVFTFSESLAIAFSGNPSPSAILDPGENITVTQMGGELFSLESFNYSCFPACDFVVGSTAVTSGSTSISDFETFNAVPGSFTDLSSLFFSFEGTNAFALLDNIVFTIEDVSEVPLPASIVMLIGGLMGLGALRHARRRA